MVRAVVQPRVDYWSNYVDCSSYELRETEAVLDETCMCRNLGPRPKGSELTVRGPETRWQLVLLEI
jgi:hypothetical protein